MTNKAKVEEALPKAIEFAKNWAKENLGMSVKDGAEPELHWGFDRDPRTVHIFLPLQLEEGGKVLNHFLKEVQLSFVFGFAHEPTKDGGAKEVWGAWGLGIKFSHKDGGRNGWENFGFVEIPGIN